MSANCINVVCKKTSLENIYVRRFGLLLPLLGWYYAKNELYPLISEPLDKKYMRLYTMVSYINSYIRRVARGTEAIVGGFI